MTSLRGRDLTPVEFPAGQDESLDPFTFFECFDDRGNILDRDVTIKEMIGLDQYRYARRTLVEAARGTNPRLQLGEPSLEKLQLQGLVHRLGPLGRARPFWIVVGPPIRAHENITMPLPHRGKPGGATRQGQALIRDPPSASANSSPLPTNAEVTCSSSKGSFVKGGAFGQPTRAPAAPVWLSAKASSARWHIATKPLVIRTIYVKNFA